MPFSTYYISEKGYQQQFNIPIIYDNLVRHTNYIVKILKREGNPFDEV